MKRLLRICLLCTVAMVAFCFAGQGSSYVEPLLCENSTTATITPTASLDELTSFDISSPSATAVRTVTIPSPNRILRRTTIGNQTTPRLDNQTILQSGHIQCCRTRLANYSVFGEISFAPAYLIPTFIIHRRLLI